MTKYASYYLDSFNFDDSVANPADTAYITMNYHGGQPISTPMISMNNFSPISQVVNLLEPGPKNDKVFLYVTVYKLQGEKTAIPIGRSRTNVLNFTADWITNNNIPVLSAADPQKKIGELAVKLFYPQPNAQAHTKPANHESSPYIQPSPYNRIDDQPEVSNPYSVPTRVNDDGVYKRNVNPYSDL